MLADGLVDEVRHLLTRYSTDLPSMSGIHYKEVADFVQGLYDEEKMIELINIHDWQLTRKQMTWLKRDPEIKWVKTNEAADKIITDFIYT